MIRLSEGLADVFKFIYVVWKRSEEKRSSAANKMLTGRPVEGRLKLALLTDFS
jgi:hypothetical protein